VRRAAIVAAVAALALWGAAPRLADRVLGIGAVDHFGTLWFHARVRDALAGDLAGLLHATDLYFPWGQDLLRNTGVNVLDGLVAAPFAALGPVLGHNALLIAVMVANGLAAALYARDHAADAGAPFAAGLAFAVAPFPLYELAEGRPAQALLVVFVLFQRALERAIRGAGSPAAAGAWLALLGYQYWFYGLFGALIAAAGGAVWAIRPPPGRTRVQVLGALVVLAGVAVLLVAPVAGPLAWALAAGEVPGLLDPADPRGLLLHTFQPAYAAVGALDDGAFVVTQRAVPLALGLAGLAVARRPAELAMALAALLLAIGPVLVVAGHVVPEPLYGALATVLPPLRRLWHPSRAIAALAVLGVGWLARLPALPRALLVALGLGEAVAAGLLPLSTWDASVPAGYRCLAGAGDGALIELPFAASQRHLWYQARHGRPILGGMHEGAPDFQPDEAVALREDNTFVAALLAAGRGARGGPLPTDADRDAVRALGYRFVVLQKDELPADASGPGRLRRRLVEDQLAALLGPPAWDDARTRVWAPFGDALPCAGSPPEPDATPGEPVRDRWVRRAASSATHATSAAGPGEVPVAHPQPSGSGAVSPTGGAGAGVPGSSSQVSPASSGQGSQSSGTPSSSRSRRPSLVGQASHASPSPSSSRSA
jgi:hypothetical protein